MTNKLLILVCCLLIICMACKDDKLGVPKPRLYPWVEFPKKNPQKLELDYCDFNFVFPDYGTAVQDSFYFDEKIVGKCWFDIVFPKLNGRLHCSYIGLENREHFDEMVQDVYELVAKHNIKANYRDEIRINYPEKSVYGMQYEIDGPVASPLQFYLTDSLNHFLRASLYFNAQVDPDSIAPVYEFVKTDVHDMIRSFEWN